jgi:hypothetical protein
MHNASIQFGAIRFVELATEEKMGGEDEEMLVSQRLC